MLKQEMGWFDREKNNTGALCARLSTSAEVKYLFFFANCHFFSSRLCLEAQVLRLVRYTFYSLMNLILLKVFL